MTIVRLVRHGRAAAGWDVDPDPGLDELGRTQAAAAAVLLDDGSRVPILSSPLRRCRETAAPLAARWSAEVVVEPGVTEIPSPEGYDLTSRVEWLRAAMAGEWSALGARYTSFRDSVVDTVVSLAGRHPEGCVVFSHFIAINAVIGAALGDDRLVIRSLDNASVTVVDIVGSRIELVEGGREADTLIR